MFWREHSFTGSDNLTMGHCVSGVEKDAPYGLLMEWADEHDFIPDEFISKQLVLIFWARGLSALIFWACVLVRSIGSTWINWHEENCLTWWVEKSTSGKQSALLLVGHVVHRPPRPFQMNYLAGSNGLLYTRARHFQASDTILISYKTLRPVMELELKVGIRLSNSKSCI